MRSVTETVGSWFDENETAQVMRLMKALDPAFNRESFERELREYIVPEVVDAYLSADKESLKSWCSEAVRGLTMLGFVSGSSPNLFN
jgi:import inner membrane translocase subunit TIM44